MRGADVTSQPNSRQGRGAEAAARHVTHRPQHTAPPTQQTDNMTAGAAAKHST